MKAIVCDCCGKTELIPDDNHCFPYENTYRLFGPDRDLTLDLCKECAEKLVQATRGEKKEEV